jgi:teichuronic acid exporter
VLQTLVGAVIAHVTARPDVFWMIACLAGVFLTLPFGQIQAHLIVRDNRLSVLAGIAVVQVAVDNLLTALLAVCGFGP